MRISRCYVEQPLQAGQTLRLEGPAAHYLRTVLRLKPGLPVTVFNGEGGEYPGTVTEMDRKQVVITLSGFQPVDRESPLAVDLGLCISRGERMDLAIQKAVELGVHRLSPLLSRRCVVRLDESRRLQRVQHWQGVVHSACEQCGRNVPPLVAPIQTLPDWLEEHPAATRLVLDPEAEHGFESQPVAEDAVALLIGPEGGLDEIELSLARGRGFAAIHLGPRVLRTETAVIAGLTAIQVLWGDLAG